MTTLSSPTASPPLIASSDQDWSALLKQILAGQSLSIEQSAALMEGWVAGAVPAVLSGAILSALQSKGVSANELTGMVQVMRLLVSPSEALQAANDKGAECTDDRHLRDGRRWRFYVQHFNGGGVCSGGGWGECG